VSGDPLRVAVLASGTGSNLQAILDKLHGKGAVEVIGVCSDGPDAMALERARRTGVETAVFERADYESRELRDEAIAAWLAERDTGLIVLAGYMQLLSPGFIRAFEGRIVNVHPALLPAFPGLDAIGQAIEHGAKVTGVTVHFVDEGVDTGPIILQRAIELPYTRTREDVEAEIHKIEHELLPRAVELIATGAVSIDPGNPRRVRVGE
jgi:phosphoribosylglycinamide formyltransferase-1